MGKFIVRGGRPLCGEINVCGSKNAALPLIFASLTVEGVCTIRNVPDIADVDVAISLIRDEGAQVVRAGSTLTVDARHLEYRPPREDLCKKIRASTYLIGALLARFGRAELCAFGGCNFSERPIDMHLYAAGRLGAELLDCELRARRLVGADIYFDKQSVGATVNALLMASRAAGVTRIFNPAVEPHVKSLVSFLSRAGVRIEARHGSFTVFGTEPVSTSVEVIFDMIEAGTFISLALLTGSHFKIRGVNIQHLESFLHPLIDSGAIFAIEGDSLIADGSLERRMDIVTGPYPAFPTDLQPIIAPLMLKFGGGSITDEVWRGRFGYLEELVRFGGGYTLCSNRAEIYPSRLHPAAVSAPDLRGGAALLACALATDGESVIDGCEHIQRGYEKIEKRLRMLGAAVSFVPT